jgi:hypothetical protein
MSPEEKVAFAKRTDAKITGVLDTLTLTARQPYVEDRGYIVLNDGSLRTAGCEFVVRGRDSGTTDLDVWWATPDPTASYLVDFEIRPQMYASKKFEVWVEGSKSVIEPAKDARHLTVIAVGLGTNEHYVTLRPAASGDNYVKAIEITRLK